MAIVVHCPHCAKAYRVSAEIVGRRVKCQHCGEQFEAAEAAPAPASAAPKAAAVPPAVRQADGFFEVARAGEVTIVRLLTARMNSDNVEEIGAELLALAADPANKRMVLNLAGVEFLFSTALGKLVALEKKLQAQRGTLRLCELRPLVREALENAGLTLILKLFDTEQQAVAAKWA
jgi:anti-sigma B factor antagonist